MLTGGFFVINLPPWIGWFKWLSYICEWSLASCAAPALAVWGLEGWPWQLRAGSPALSLVALFSWVQTTCASLCPPPPAACLIVATDYAYGVAGNFCFVHTLCLLICFWVH